MHKSTEGIHGVNPAWYLAVMTSWAPTTYKTKNWSGYNRALKQRGSLSIWFDAEMAWYAEPSNARQWFAKQTMRGGQAGTTASL